MRLRLKRPWSAGTVALEMDALALLSRLAASVPPARQHVVIDAGVLASHSRWRPLVIPPPPEQSISSPDEKAEPAKPSAAASAEPSAAASAEASHAHPRCRTGTRCRSIKWAQLIRLTFGIDLEHCPACGGQMKLRALVQDPASIERGLRPQGLWSPLREPAPPAHRPTTGAWARDRGRSRHLVGCRRLC